MSPMGLQTFRDRLSVSAADESGETCPCIAFPEVTGHEDLSEVVEGAVGAMVEGIAERMGQGAVLAAFESGAVVALRHSLVILAAAGFAAGIEAASAASGEVPLVDDETAWEGALAALSALGLVEDDREGGEPTSD